MTLRFLMAVLHLLPLAIGIAAVHARGRALRRTTSTADLKNVMYADNWYGVAALLWVGTGLWRAFGGLEKGTEYYVTSHWFIGKMGLFLLVLVLEMYPMIMFIRWRRALRNGSPIDLGPTRRLAALSIAQVPLLLLMVFMAAAMARAI